MWSWLNLAELVAFLLACLAGCIVGYLRARATNRRRRQAQIEELYADEGSKTEVPTWEEEVKAWARAPIFRSAEDEKALVKQLQEEKPHEFIGDEVEVFGKSPRSLAADRWVTLHKVQLGNLSTTALAYAVYDAMTALWWLGDVMKLIKVCRYADSPFGQRELVAPEQLPRVAYAMERIRLAITELRKRDGVTYVLFNEKVATNPMLTGGSMETPTLWAAYVKWYASILPIFYDEDTVIDVRYVLRSEQFTATDTDWVLDWLRGIAICMKEYGAVAPECPEGIPPQELSPQELVPQLS